MTRPPFINPAQSSEEIFHDRRSRKAEAMAPGPERRARQQFDAIPWWLKVNYTKAQDQSKTSLSEEEPPKHVNNK
jgi:hypothetical protein